MTLKVTQKITRTERTTAIGLILGLAALTAVVAIVAGPEETTTVANAGEQSATTVQAEQALMTITAAGFGEINICTAPPERLAKFYETIKIKSGNMAPAIPQTIMNAALEKYAAGNVADCAEIATHHVLGAVVMPIATTSAAESTQLLLPPPPPSATETNIRNLSIVAVYAATCKRNNPDYQPDGRFGSVIEYMFNQYTVAYMSQIRAATALSFNFVRDLGGAAKFCPVADQDASIQTAIKTIQAMAVR